MNVRGLIEKMKAVNIENQSREVRQMHESAFSALNIYFKNWEENKSNVVVCTIYTI